MKRPCMNDIGKNDLDRGSSQLLGVLSFYLVGSHVDVFPSSDQSLFWGGAIAASLKGAYVHLGKTRTSYVF